MPGGQFRLPSLAFCLFGCRAELSSKTSPRPADSIKVLYDGYPFSHAERKCAHGHDFAQSWKAAFGQNFPTMSAHSVRGRFGEGQFLAFGSSELPGNRKNVLNVKVLREIINEFCQSRLKAEQSFKVRPPILFNQRAIGIRRLGHARIHKSFFSGIRNVTSNLLSNQLPSSVKKHRVPY